MNIETNHIANVRRLIPDPRAIYWEDAGAMSAEDASKGAAVVVGATVAIGAMLVAPRAGFGVALALGSIAAVGAFFAVKKATEA